MQKEAQQVQKEAQQVQKEAQQKKGESPLVTEGKIVDMQQEESRGGERT